LTQEYWPFATGAGATVTEARWSAMAKQWMPDGVLAGYLNQLQVFADSTGMQVKVRSGEAHIQGHVFRSDAEEILAVAANNSGSTRLDRVVVRLSWVAKTITIAVKTGTASLPALQQDSSVWEISLAQISVANLASTIASGNVSDLRTLVSSGLSASATDPPTANAQVTAGSLCKGSARVNNTGTPSLASDYNVSGVVDNGLGDVSVTWDRDFASVDYACVVTPGTTTNPRYATVQELNTGSVRVRTWNNSGAADDVGFTLAAFGTLG
jgi:hypothetical protein